MSHPPAPDDAAPPPPPPEPDAGDLRPQDRATVCEDRNAPTHAGVGPHAAPVADIGQYRCVAELGRGGMGVVYRAQDLRLGRQVALKVMLSGTYAAPADRERFSREARLAAQVEHVNIVPVYDVGEHEGRPYYTMRLVDGQPLADLLKERGKLPPRTAAEIAAAVGRALHHAHSHQVIHRDIKPANVLLARLAPGEGGQPDTILSDGRGRPEAAFRVLVADFGLARPLDLESKVTLSGQMVGTPHYMAPEQAGGRNREVGPASDQYALGTVLYEMVAGRTPFETLVEKIEAERAPSPRTASPSLARDLETIILKTLDKEPARRYPDAGALVADLERYVEGQPIAARPPSLLGRLARRARRHWVQAAGAAALVLLAGGLAVHARVRDAQDRERLAAAGQHLDTARELLRAADAAPPAAWPAALDRARQELDAALELRPALRDARLRRAGLATAAGDFAAAADDLVRLGQTGPDDEAAYQAQILRDEIARARADLRLPERLAGEVQRLQAGTGPLAARARVRDHLAARRGTQALAAAEGLDADDPESIHLRVTAVLLGRARDLGAEVDGLRRLERIRPRWAPDWTLRAAVYAALGLEREALEAARTALELRPAPAQQDIQDLCDAYRNHYSAHDDPELRRRIEEITERFPRSPWGWVQLGKFHREAGRFDEAARAFERADALPPRDPSLIGHLFLNRYDAGKSEEALRGLEEALRAWTPDALAAQPLPVHALVDALLDRGCVAQAEPLVRACVERAPTDRHLLDALALVCMDSGRSEEAAQHLTEAIRAWPEDAPLHARRSRCWRQLRKHDEALADLRRAVELHPVHANYRVTLGGLLLMRLDLSGAAEQWAEAAILTPQEKVEARFEAWRKGDFTGRGDEGGRSGREDRDLGKALRGDLIQRMMSTLAGALVKKGMKSLEEGDDTRAERSFSAACQAVADHPIPYVCLARLEAKRGATMAAVVLLERAAAHGYKKFAELPQDRWLAVLAKQPRVRALIEGK